MEIKIHELAEIFPEMSAEQFDDLKEDIKENGQSNPIITYKDAVIDGKNRLKALTELKIDPIFQEFEGNPDKLFEYVIGQNLKRRHLNSNQRAVASLKCLELLKAQAKERQGQRNDLKTENDTPASSVAGTSADTAAKMFGSNRKYVNDAQKIQDRAPEMIKEIETGKKTIPKALKEVKAKEEAKAAANRNGEETRKAFWRLYTTKHGNRYGGLIAADAGIDKFPEFSKRMEDGVASILKSYKSHHEDLSDILNKIQIDGNGQPDHAPFQNNINECIDIIFYLKKIILLHEAANENVQFYADNRDTLNNVFKKETKKIVEGFKPIWEFKFYSDEQDEYIDFLGYDTDDINEVKSVMRARIPYDNCIKAVATVEAGIPRRLHNLHVPYVKIKEFKHDPITILPENDEKYLKKPESKSEPEKIAMDEIFV